jgi:hypothetical protein
MSRTPNRVTPPNRILDSYKNIRKGALFTSKSLSDEAIGEFQRYLNEAQSNNASELQAQSLIQYLYRRNPNNFCRFLTRSRLSHLILWTEAKCIVRHFGLRGMVYVKWHDQGYVCSLHKQHSKSHGFNVNQRHLTTKRDQPVEPFEPFEPVEPVEPFEPFEPVEPVDLP